MRLVLAELTLGRQLSSYEARTTLITRKGRLEPISALTQMKR
jgi:hypothetical protein